MNALRGCAPNSAGLEYQCRLQCPCGYRFRRGCGRLCRRARDARPGRAPGAWPTKCWLSLRLSEARARACVRRRSKLVRSSRAADRRSGACIRARARGWRPAFRAKRCCRSPRPGCLCRDECRSPPRAPRNTPSFGRSTVIAREPARTCNAAGPLGGPSQRPRGRRSWSDRDPRRRRLRPLPATSRAVRRAGTPRRSRPSRRPRGVEQGRRRRCRASAG